MEAHEQAARRAAEIIQRAVADTLETEKNTGGTDFRDALYRMGEYSLNAIRTGRALALDAGALKPVGTLLLALALELEELKDEDFDGGIGFSLTLLGASLLACMIHAHTRAVEVELDADAEADTARPATLDPRVVDALNELLRAGEPKTCDVCHEVEVAADKWLCPACRADLFRMVPCEGPRERRERLHGLGVWTDARIRETYYRDMHTAHLQNVKRILEVWAEANYPRILADAYRMLGTVNGEMATLAMEQEINHLERDGWEALYQAHPFVEYLERELDRREGFGETDAS